MIDTDFELDRAEARKDRLFRKFRAAASGLHAVEQLVRSPRSNVVRSGTMLFGGYRLELTQRELTKVTTKAETEGRTHYVSVVMRMREAIPGCDDFLDIAGFTFADAANAKSFVRYAFGCDLVESKDELADRQVRMLVVTADDAEDEFDTVAAPKSEVATAADDHSAAAPVDPVPASVRKVAALFGCSIEAAAYIDALETRVARLEEKVGELRYDVRKVRRAA